MCVIIVVLLKKRTHLVLCINIRELRAVLCLAPGVHKYHTTESNNTPRGNQGVLHRCTARLVFLFIVHFEN